MKILGIFLIVLLGLGALFVFGKPLLDRKSLEERMAELGPRNREILARRFEAAGLPYPPGRVTLVGLKEEKTLEIWVMRAQEWRKVHTYKILGLSGGPGPKLKAGDGQVPEGFYNIEELDPGLPGLKLNFPNDYDREMARNDGRGGLGGGVFIQGGESTGCLAMGQEAVEELFTLAHDTGLARVYVILAPRDFRKGGFDEEGWRRGLYNTLSDRLKALGAAQSGSWNSGI